MIKSHDELGRIGDGLNDQRSGRHAGEDHVIVFPLQPAGHFDEHLQLAVHQVQGVVLEGVVVGLRFAVAQLEITGERCRKLGMFHDSLEGVALDHGAGRAAFSIPVFVNPAVF